MIRTQGCPLPQMVTHFRGLIRSAKKLASVRAHDAARGGKETAANSLASAKPETEDILLSLRYRYCKFVKELRKVISLRLFDDKFRKFNLESCEIREESVSPNSQFLITSFLRFFRSFSGVKSFILLDDISKVSKFW